MDRIAKVILKELREHVPFTVVGALSGVVITLVVYHVNLSAETAGTLFKIFHPGHVFLSAMVTAGVYRLHSKGRVLPTILIGYVGAISIGTLSDCLMPYACEVLLDMPHAHLHIGFIEHWYLVNPLAAAGIAIAFLWPKTKFPHAGHVLLSTWASLFHMMMARGESLTAGAIVVIGTLLFLAVWLPCCLSDIVFPLLFTRRPSKVGHHH
jgi:hypothetical protein